MNEMLIEILEGLIAGCKKRASKNKSKIGKLWRYKNLRLTYSEKKGKLYYTQYSVESDETEYLGRDDMKKIYEIKEYRYREKYGKILESNIKKYEKCVSILRSVKPDDPKVVADSMCKAYSGLDDSVVLEQDAAIEAWKNELLELKRKYPPPYPEYLTHKGSDGNNYRSKSEVIQAEVLRALGIPYVPEAPLFIKGKVFHPDFTMLDLRDWTNKYSEHQGMMAKENYRNDFIDRVYVLISAGLVPGNNLLLTFDDINGNISSADLERELRSMMGIW